MPQQSIETKENRTLNGHFDGERREPVTVLVIPIDGQSPLVIRKDSSQGTKK